MTAGRRAQFASVLIPFRLSMLERGAIVDALLPVVEDMIRQVQAEADARWQAKIEALAEHLTTYAGGRHAAVVPALRAMLDGERRPDPTEDDQLSGALDR